MCLIDRKQFRCSETKIPIWKVVRLYKGVYYSPYQNTKIHKLNQIVNLQDEHQLCNFPDVVSEFRFGIKVYLFEDGFYHAFLNKKAADQLMCCILARSPKNPYDITVVEGYIPEDVRYALDVDGASVCARKMILNI